MINAILLIDGVTISIKLRKIQYENTNHINNAMYVFIIRQTIYKKGDKL